jgi:N-acyl homoserine lactone hydrolase
MMVATESGVIRYPITGYAVIHQQGTLVFDTGLSAALVGSKDELGDAAHLFEVELAAEQLIAAQLEARGIEVDSVGYVVNSHLHFDHCGQNAMFPEAETLVQADEWAEAHGARAGRRYPGTPFATIEAGDIRLIEGPLDVFGDGTVRIVPTPGHTAGHQSLLVRESDGPGAASALLVGDACYFARMLDRQLFPSFGHDLARQRASYGLLTTLAAQGTRFIFSHDVDNWDHVPFPLQA